MMSQNTTKEQKQNQIWEDLRFDMLEYCRYDTLSMVAILQGLKEKW
jgi:hypothetical protein